MTSHEFARKLLEMEDLPLVIYYDNTEESKEVTDLPTTVYRDMEYNKEDTFYLREIELFGMDITEMEPVLEISQ